MGLRNLNFFFTTAGGVVGSGPGVVEFTGWGVVLGNSPDNKLVLNDSSVSMFGS